MNNYIVLSCFLLVIVGLTSSQYYFRPTIYVTCQDPACATCKDETITALDPACPKSTCIARYTYYGYTGYGLAPNCPASFQASCTTVAKCASCPACPMNRTTTYIQSYVYRYGYIYYNGGGFYG